MSQHTAWLLGKNSREVMLDILGMECLQRKHMPGTAANSQAGSTLNQQLPDSLLGKSLYYLLVKCHIYWEDFTYFTCIMVLFIKLMQRFIWLVLKCPESELGAEHAEQVLCHWANQSVPQ